MPPGWMVAFIGVLCVSAAGLWIGLAKFISDKSPVDKNDNCPGVTFVTREEWNSSIPNIPPSLLDPVKYMFIHHTAEEECNNQERCSELMREIQKFHIKVRGWDDIGYSFLIGGDGNVYIGRDWQRIGAHTYGYNSVSYGISFMGNFMDHVPSDNMVQAAKNLIRCGVDQGYVQANYSLYGHRDGRCTLCPGDAFYKTLSSWDKWHVDGPIEVYCQTS